MAKGKDWGQGDVDYLFELFDKAKYKEYIKETQNQIHGFQQKQWGKWTRQVLTTINTRSEKLSLMLKNYTIEEIKQKMQADKNVNKVLKTKAFSYLFELPKTEEQIKQEYAEWEVRKEADGWKFRVPSTTKLIDKIFNKL